MNRPTSLEEWAEHINQFAGQKLYSMAVAANSHDFGRALLEEGASIDDVEQIILLFVRRLRATGTKVPAEGPYNMVNMALTDPVAMRGPTMSEEEAEFIAGTQKSAGGDDFDMFEMEASLDL